MVKWQTIPGFKRYQVSNNGLIRIDPNAPTRSKQQLNPGALVATSKTKKGYVRVRIINDGGFKETIKTHVAVALAFHGPRPSKRHCSLHWDDNPANNTVTNIRWGTYDDNMKDRIRNDKNHTKLTASQVREIKQQLKSKKRTLTSLGIEYGVSLQTIWGISKNKTWQHIT